MIRKILVLLVIAFAVYYLLSAPEGAADAVKVAFSAVNEGFGQIMRFFERLAA